MKAFYLLIFSGVLFNTAAAQIINFPDPNFKNKLLLSSTQNGIAYNGADMSMAIDANGNGEIEVAEAQNVYRLNMNNSGLTNLTGISNFSNLTHLKVYVNNISALDLSMLSNLEILECNQNYLVSLNVAGLTELTTVICWGNSLTILDLAGCSSLEDLNCSSNQLTTLILKNGSYENSYNFTSNPMLSYICVDEAQLQQMQNIVAAMPDMNVHVNSYCSFTPGGSYFTIQGPITFDSNSNGCDIEDDNTFAINFLVSDGTSSTNFISDDTGEFTYTLPSGTHTITPYMENPDYFTISPASLTVTFPTDMSPYNQNFCITPNGSHDDIYAVLIPVVAARPGFDADYKVVLKNKGTTTQSGTLTLNYQDMFLDVVSTNPLTTAQLENLLSWDYSNLLPQETREFDIVFNVNSPMETPAVNADDRLNFVATAALASDVYQSDNISDLKQVVVNSLDPNDKTCLEGTTVGSEMIGEYVHYVIRFENTGTFAAENIVVKDMIDLTMFDISTLVPIHASHPFTTRINGNKVEFIFENIMLPFEDATNDGYVAFKIKTLPTLVIGDTFTNSASIYFDYNFPIVTDPAVTSIQNLGNAEFDFSKYFTLYPNPANDVLNIKSDGGIEVSSFEVCNILGQLVIAIPNAETTSSIDVSELRSGTYFLKINSDKGTTNAKFVRN